jgi:hypothetical protein
LHSSISLNIYNRYQDIHLTSPIYFIYGGNWHVAPDQEIDANAVTRNCIELDSGQDILKGALIYKIQRKHTESGEFIQDESKSIQLMVAWYVEPTKGLDVRALLVEHDKEFNWGEDNLRKLYQKYWHSLDALVSPFGSSWLLNDITLATTIKVMNGGYKWDISISEGIKNNVEKPLGVDAER